MDGMALPAVDLNRMEICRNALSGGVWSYM